MHFKIKINEVEIFDMLWFYFLWKHVVFIMLILLFPSNTTLIARVWITMSQSCHQKCHKRYISVLKPEKIGIILLALIFIWHSIFAILVTNYKKQSFLLTLVLLLPKALPGLAAVELAAPQLLGRALDHHRLRHHVGFLAQQWRLRRGRLFRLRFGQRRLCVGLRRRRRRLMTLGAVRALAAAADGRQRWVGWEVGGRARRRGGGQVRGAAKPRVPPPEQLGQQPAGRRHRLLLAHLEAAVGRAAAERCCGWRLRWLLPADRRQVKRLRRRLVPNFLGLRQTERVERTQCSRVFQQWGLRCSWLTASRVICGCSPAETNLFYFLVFR